MMASEETGIRHACGVFGCVLSDLNADVDAKPDDLDVGHLVYTGLAGLQHRGQESAGIVTSTGKPYAKFQVHKGMGLVSQIFNDQIIQSLSGRLGIGHTRYSTSGVSDNLHCQPFVVHSIHGPLALGHNGELVNAHRLRQEVLDRGVGLSTHSDSELITQMLCLTPPQGEPDGPDWKARIEHLMHISPLSYALVIMHRDKIYGVRDVYGNRPLSVATIQAPEWATNGSLVTYDEATDQIDGVIDGWVISSESCAFRPIGAYLRREVLPGEIVELSRKGLRSLGRVVLPADKRMAFCIFEYVYFARPDSYLEGQMVYQVRVRSGHQLALEAPVEADLVGSVPESGTPAAKGFAAQSGLPFIEVLCRNRYIGRTFIQPSNRLRKLGVAKKFGALVGNFQGKRIVLVDDSIVRGTTMGPIIKLLKDAGAREVHVRIASPPIRHPCYMGINIPTREELIATTHDEHQLAHYVGADSVGYLSVDGLLTAVTEAIQQKDRRLVGHCTACLTGHYPVRLEW